MAVSKDHLNKFNNYLKMLSLSQLNSWKNWQLIRTAEIFLGMTNQLHKRILTILPEPKSQLLVVRESNLRM
ncbi:hypothetical protein B9T62_02590 [Paenibacillus donghaensis]|uniref:Uncharacterized protein n=1 Tax=Paenibacillus donghaensis TaxID=414771 RepID=A0A2Z2KJ48_9BACL|nr:hypothetical protein B9T62_02590 [Paenibacillus donghaensis]